MSLTDPDRKPLWGKAANRCAICRVALTRPPDAGDDEALIRHEAHIIGAKPRAARYVPLDPDVRDSYRNRIRLCPSHHAEVNRQPQKWTTERLVKAKADHETLMAARTADHPGPRPVLLELILSGRELLKLVAGAEAYETDWEEFANDEEMQAGRDLLQNAVGWGEIANDIGVAGQIAAAKGLGEQLAGAMELGLNFTAP